MRYSFDDQYNVVTKKFSHLSSSNDHLITEFAIDYFQYQFDEIEIHNCWKIIHNANTQNNYNIPQSTDIDRLENISWRKWAKMKFDLEEVPPEMVNWYKDCDITWLYGPLAGSSSSLSHQVFQIEPPTSSSTAYGFDRTGLVPSRTSSFSSMTSASTAASLDDEHEHGLGGKNEDIFVDEHYLDNIGHQCSYVKPILKNKRATSLGFLEFEAPSSVVTKKRTASSNSGKKYNKSVSFDAIVRIRQFEIEEEACYD